MTPSRFLMHHPHIRTVRWHDIWPTLGELGLRNENIPVSFEVKTRGDLWEVLRDGKLVGGYVSQINALAAARQAIQRIFCNGGAAELTRTS